MYYSIWFYVVYYKFYVIFLCYVCPMCVLGVFIHPSWPCWGFKSQHGTPDALFLARRLVDQAVACKDGQLVLLALDWAKAFDSVSPDALLTALHRFGLPESFWILSEASRALPPSTKIKS